MSSEKAIFSLLSNDASLMALVPAARMFAGVIPQETALPALAYGHVSTIENTAIDANSPYAMVTSRVQVTVVTKDYPSLKNIISLVRKACNYKRGSINGVIVNSVVRDLVGPDFRDDEASLFMQSIDFRVTWHEAN